jgi:hypothetical protein
MSTPNIYPTSDWKSWHDFIPGSAPTFRIRGKIIFPAPGYSAVLAPRNPQGLNPEIYLFDLTVIPAADSTGDEKGNIETDVSYSEDTESHYTEVRIDPGEISVDVEIVS